MWRRREGAGHLSSGESAVWPGRESGPLAGTTHEHEHVCRTHAHAYARMHGGNCGPTITGTEEIREPNMCVNR